jgi:predicted Zn-dependent protease
MKWLSLLFALWVFIGCAKAPITGRDQLILISPNEELALGSSESEKLKQNATLSTDKATVARIRNIGNKIAAATGREDYDWEFNVIESEEVNAFCLPGGKVFFYTGILALMDNDDQIATVMGHEISHALARHGAERISMQMLNQAGAQVLAIALDVPPQYQGLYEQAYGMSTQIGLILPYSRTQEHEADQIGIYYMYKAGYDPYEAIKFWEKMKAKSEGKAPPEFLSTHPSDQARIDAIGEYIQSLPPREPNP